MTSLHYCIMFPYCIQGEINDAKFWYFKLRLFPVLMTADGIHDEMLVFQYGTPETQYDKIIIVIIQLSF